MLSLAFVFGAAVAAPVTVTVSLPPLKDGGGRVVVDVEATASQGTAAPARGLVELLPGAEARLQLVLAPGSWNIQARADEYWTPGVALDVAQGGDTVRLPLWRTAPVSVSAHRSRGAVAELIFTFRGSPETPARVRVPEGTHRCVLQNGSGACKLPVGRLDIRVGAPGFAPEYLWSHEIASDRPNTLVAALQPGASVSGFVEVEEAAAAEGASVEILTAEGQRIESSSAKTQPNVHSGGGSEQRRHPWQSRTNARGFFQIRGVAPGEYRVVGKLGARMGVGVVSVKAGLEARLSERLVLEPPMSLDVSIEPSLAPGGGPWTLKLVRLEPFPADLYEGAISATTRAGPLTRGVYALEVWNGGDRWHGENVAIEQAPAPVHIRLPLVGVHGTLSLAGKPLQGRVTFGGSNGAVRIPLESDGAGRFQGTLPRPGDWVVSVEALEPPVTRKLARVAVEPGPGGQAEVSIELPDTALRGRVVDQGGMATKAIVAVYPQGAPDRNFQVFVEQDGEFVLRGLAEGGIALEAEAPGERRSDLVSLDLAEGSTHDVTLVVRGDRKVQGVMRSVTGSVLPGASLLAFPSGPASGSRYYSTDEAGRFVLSLPPGTREVVVVYWAPAHALHFQRREIPEDAPLLLQADPRAGDLAIEFDKELDVLKDTGASVPVVLHEGAQVPLVKLFMLGVRRAGPAQTPQSSLARIFVLPQMAPGEYAVCLGSRAEAMNTRPIARQCERGTLHAAAELRLNVSMPGQASPSGLAEQRR